MYSNCLYILRSSQRHNGIGFLNAILRRRISGSLSTKPENEGFKSNSDLQQETAGVGKEPSLKEFIAQNQHIEAGYSQQQHEPVPYISPVDIDGNCKKGDYQNMIFFIDKPANPSQIKTICHSYIKFFLNLTNLNSGMVFIHFINVCRFLL